jgi:hypothetical protein
MLVSHLKNADERIVTQSALFPKVTSIHRVISLLVLKDRLIEIHLITGLMTVTLDGSHTLLSASAII